MCGRYSFILEAVTTQEEIERRYAAADVRWDPESRDRYRGSYNVAPSTENPIVKRESPETIELQRWGLVPHWADDPDEWDAINARQETVHENNVFRQSFKERRCLVPAQGFFEWRDEDEGPKQPYRVIPTDAEEDLFLFAGIWSSWTPPEEQSELSAFGVETEDAGDVELRSYAILTMDANDAIAEVHDRMPVMLHDDELETWLRGGPDEARLLLDDAGFRSDEIELYSVSRTVNDPGNDSAEVWLESDGE